MENTNPKISIIVPVYNVESYLPQCLESLIAQTYANIQILCVNDGSTDNSRKIISQYAERDSRICCLDKKNGGLSSARNYAHAYVEGDYIMYLDSDDWIEENTCALAISQAVLHDADVVFWNYIRELGSISKPRRIFGDEKILFANQEAVSKLHRRFLGLYQEELRHPENANSMDTAWGKLYRSDIILENQIEYIDTKMIGTEDALFNLYVFGYVNSAVYIPECLNHYRRDNGTSLTKTYKRELKIQWDRLHGYMRDYIVDNHLGSDYVQALDNRIALSIIGLGMNIVRSGSDVHKISEVRKIISSEEYRNASKKLSLQYFPLHWKLFFWCAKYRLSAATYLLLWCIRKLKGN